MSLRGELLATAVVGVLLASCSAVKARTLTECLQANMHFTKELDDDSAMAAINKACAAEFAEEERQHPTSPIQTEWLDEMKRERDVLPQAWDRKKLIAICNKAVVGDQSYEYWSQERCYWWTDKVTIDRGP
jgi:hypothetical protein